MWENKWNNENQRTIKAGDLDPDDSRFQLLKVGDILPEARIDGVGQCGVMGSSPRLYIRWATQDQLFQDVELSCDVLVETEVDEVYLVVRSNHEDRPKGFGGYYAYFNFKDNLMYFKKELTHVIGYSSRINETDIAFSKDAWHHITMSAKNVPNVTSAVSLHATFNGEKIWALDNGNITCGDVKNSDPFTNAAKWCFIRTNNPKDKGTLKKTPGVFYRDAMIKKI